MLAVKLGSQMATKAIRGKVARVLNSRELALNIGSDHGVRDGMLFDVLDQKGEDIIDPDTGDVLGSIERPKVRVRVVSVQGKLSVASTYKSKKINIGGAGDIFSSRISDMLKPPNYVTRFETFKTNEQTWEDLSEKESFVKIGDPVVSVVDLDTPIDVQ